MNVWMPGFFCVSGLIKTTQHKAERKSPRSPSSVRVTSKLSTKKGEKINPDQLEEELGAHRKQKECTEDFKSNQSSASWKNRL